MIFLKRKALVIFLSLFLFLSGTAQLKVKSCSYRDTSTSFEKYDIKLQYTYSRKKLFTRTTVVVVNKTDSFLLINGSSVTLSTAKFSSQPSYYKGYGVVLPRDTQAFYLKLHNKDFRSPLISINFPDVRVTSSVVRIHPERSVVLKKRNEISIINIHVKILDVIEKASDYKVRLRFSYDKTNFFELDYNKIFLSTSDGKHCEVVKKIKHYRELNPNRKVQDVLLSFSKDCFKNEKAEIHLVFKDILKEYSLSKIEGFRLDQVLAPGKRKETAKERRKREQDKKATQ